jgi:hypothetical protein
MLDYFLRRYAAQKTFTFSLKDAMATPEKIDAMMKAVNDYMEQAKQLFGIVQSDEVQDYALQFQNKVIEALKHYGADTRDDVLEVANKMDHLAFLRRDAIKAINHLTPHQFLRGKFSNEKPQLVTRIHMFWNITSLVAATRDMPFNGVSLNLIRDSKDPAFSYFAFAIKNGENVSVLTDKTKWVHPLQKGMTRRPDRHFDSKAAQFYFPYDLVPYELLKDEDGDVVGIHFTRMEGLVPQHTEAVPLKYIRDLEPGEVIWLSMLLSLIADKFYKHGWQAEKLSYTAEMIEVKDTLITDKNGNRLPVAESYQPLSLEKLTLADVTAEEIKKQVERTTGHNRWLEERYRDRIDPANINVWAAGDGKVLYLGNSTSGGVVVAEKDSWGKPRGERYDATVYEVKGMDPTEFGTEEEIRANQVWMGRYNLAVNIQREADAEFDQRKMEVMRWYRNKVEANINNLLPMIKAGDLLVEDGKYKRRVLTVAEAHSESFSYNCWDVDAVLNSNWKSGGSVVFGEWDRKVPKSNYRCYFTDTAATYRARFRPGDATDLALLTGCKVEDLHEMLRHWMADAPYVGNHILDRCDPMEFKLKNPWSNLNLAVNIYFSKRAYTRIQKDQDPRG